MKINIKDIDDDIGGNWWHYINTTNFGFVNDIPDQSNYDVSVDDILIHKEIEEGNNFPTIRYHVIKKKGTDIVNKKGLYKVLIPKLIEFVEKNEKFPWKCTLVKFFANGSAQINYQPADFDKFVLKVIPKEHGVADTRSLFEGLKSSPNPIKGEPESDKGKKGGKQWDIPSSSDPDKWYTVRLISSGKWTCTCPQFVFRKTICKHIDEVQYNM